MTTMAEVARLAGVSQTTVSHVISGKRRVSSDLIEAVCRAMDQLGYVPSRAAQTLATGSTRMVALIVPDISNSFFAELAGGIEEVVREAGYNLLLANTGFDHWEERTYLEILASRAVDGVIYAAGVPPRAEEVHRLLGVIPTVLIDEDIPGTELDAVVSDNYEGGLLVAQHLLENGHRNALLIDCPAAPTSNQERVNGFVACWTAAGGRFWKAPGDFRFESGIAAMVNSIPLVEQEEITAVFATNDLMALGALSVLHENGFQVPYQISVAGFDNTLSSAVSGPSLTTVSQSVTQMGRLAGERLLERLRHPQEPASRTVLPVRLVCRNSTGPAIDPIYYRVTTERKVQPQ